MSFESESGNSQDPQEFGENRDKHLLKHQSQATMRKNTMREVRLKQGVRTSVEAAALNCSQELGQAGSRAGRSEQELGASCRYLWHGTAGLEQQPAAASFRV